MTLNEVMKDTADAIREKTGKSDPIAPINFAEEIKSISAGGGESGGSIEYLDISGNVFLANVFATGIVEMKVTIENSTIPIEGVVGGGIAVFSLIDELRQMGATVNIIAVSYNRDAIAVTKQDGVVTTQTAHENLASRGDSYLEAYNNCPRITKEEFYTL